jgi:hypothetical protein
MQKIKIETALRQIRDGKFECTQDIKLGINIIRKPSGKLATIYITK